MDVRLTWTDCDEAGDYVEPNVLNQKDLVSRPDNMDETVLHTYEPRREKTGFCIFENKDADQLRGNREADQRLCFRYTDSTIPLLSKSKISSP